jgi:hypothetical protein
MLDPHVLSVWVFRDVNVTRVKFRLLANGSINL